MRWWMTSPARLYGANDYKPAYQERKGDYAMCRLEKMFRSGYKIFDSCYEFADDVVKKAKAQGHSDVKAYRVKTDTPGLKMFVILVREE